MILISQWAQEKLSRVWAVVGRFRFPSWGKVRDLRLHREGTMLSA